MSEGFEKMEATLTTIIAFHRNKA
ncbi:bifunctional 5'-methylthioadenosine/S-adenosylhomocysteine nucleosidase/phosphatase [Bacillus sp. B14905]|nr:bifunctional 5'-methylthioadenosine/S-adenosylhomocysteine nucleosidase/phosphatase [Bacillus sp. B14905]